MLVGQKHCRVTILLEDSGKVVNFLLNVFLFIDDFSDPVVKTSHNTSYYAGWMLGLEVEITVHVHGLPLDRDI